MSDANVFARFRFDAKCACDDEQQQQPDPPPPSASRDGDELKRKRPTVRHSWPHTPIQCALLVFI